MIQDEMVAPLREALERVTMLQGRFGAESLKRDLTEQEVAVERQVGKADDALSRALAMFDLPAAETAREATARREKAGKKPPVSRAKVSRLGGQAFQGHLVLLAGLLLTGCVSPGDGSLSIQTEDVSIEAQGQVEGGGPDGE